MMLSEKESLKCPVCKVEWFDMQWNIDNPDCYKEITCNSCKTVWRLVE